MKENFIACELLKLRRGKYNIQYNYIDTSDTKELVTFTHDSKVRDLFVDLYTVINNERHLTYSKANDAVFSRLGFDKTLQAIYVPDEGASGTILSETKSTITDKVFVLFRENTSGNLTVFNKECVERDIHAEDHRIWGVSRNSIRVGKIVRSLLTSAEVKFVDSDIETFVNKYKATYDFIGDALKRFDIVKGTDIMHWYNQENYVSGGGQLNNSCMATVDSKFFHLYSDNPDKISMLILYDDEGTIGNIDLFGEGKYTSKKIKGRALLWNIKGSCGFTEDTYFIDRIYTAHDSDISLFIEYANNNGMWHKGCQSSDWNFTIVNKNQSKSASIIINLKETDYDYYPYCDSMTFVNTNTNLISNEKSEIDAHRILRSTCGSYETGGDDEDCDEDEDDY